MLAPSGLVVVVLAALQVVAGHSYHYGQCPHVQPMSGFDMNRFLGRWYVVEKTSTHVKCLVNDFSHGRLVQTMTTWLPFVNHVVRYEGRLTEPNPSEPAAMQVKFPLNIAGASSYTVFDTDYNTYAGVYSCQKLFFWYRQAISILSRTPTLDPAIIQRLHGRLNEFGLSTKGLDTVQQTCMGLPNGIEVNIKPNIFKSFNVTRILGEGRDALHKAVNVAKAAYSLVGGRRRRDVEDDEQQTTAIADWMP